MRLIVLRAGDVAAPVAARHGEFFSWIQRAAGGVWGGAWLEHDVRTDAPLPAPGAADGFIVTGSASSVTERAAWMLRTEELIRAVVRAKVPLLGICFGHQIIAEALGGKVARNPRGREIGTVEVRVLADDPIVAGLPRTFQVNTTHEDTVTTLPPGARVLAETDLEPYAIFAVGDLTRCVQFHPEIDGAIMRGYIDARRGDMLAEGLDAAAIGAAVADTPDGAETLRNFVRHLVRREPVAQSPPKNPC